MNLKPIGDRIVIKLVEAEEKTASGIVLPSTAKMDGQGNGRGGRLRLLRALLQPPGRRPRAQLPPGPPHRGGGERAGVSARRLANAIAEKHSAIRQA